jgi:hypothetical protein
LDKISKGQTLTDLMPTDAALLEQFSADKLNQLMGKS